jgi:cytochrome c-type biogenesis protein CcmH/NrfG
VRAEAAPATQQAEQWLRAGRANDILSVLKPHVNNSPNDAMPWNLLCRTYLSLERWDNAVNACEKAVALEPDNSAYHLWLGRALGEKADHAAWFTAIRLAKRTRVEFEHAVQLRSDNLDAQSDLAEFFIEAPGFLGGGTDKAKAQAQKVAQMDAATALWIEARAAEKDGRAADAERTYKRAIETAKNKAPYHLNLASFYRRQKRYPDMEQAIRRAVDSGVASHDDIFYEAATLLYKTGRNFPGAAQFVRLYLNSPNKTEDAPTFHAHYLLGSILEKMGDPKGAAVEYRAALDLAKDYEPAQAALKRLAP